MVAGVDDDCALYSTFEDPSTILPANSVAAICILELVMVDRKS